MPDRRSALFDAIHLGLDQLSLSQYQKRILFVITDGEDNSSSSTYQEILELAQGSAAAIYVVGMEGEVGFGRTVISELVRGMGGRQFFPQQQLQAFFNSIEEDLRRSKR